jgi:TolA-binding protein
MESGRVAQAMRRALPLLLALISVPEIGWSQADPRLIAAVKLAQDGRSDSARTAVRKILDVTEPTDSLYPEILYTSGVVAATDPERRLALRRVIIEYSQSSWADDALVLLGQTEYAGGNPAATVTQIEKLVADYPNSPLLAVGSLWGSRAASDLGNAALACRLADIGLGAPSEDVELKNQLEYQKQRCAALSSAKTADSVRQAEAQAAADSAKRVAAERAAGPRNPPKNPANPAKGSFGVQIIAAPTQARADAAILSLKQAGFESFVAQETGLFKVRAGPFATRAEAQAALAKIRARLGGQPFIVPVK